MTKRAIPDIPKSAIGEERRFFEAVKEDVERIMGVRGGKILPINTSGMSGNDLTLAQKINEIIERLQE
jgi:hypothetical protein